MVLAGPLAYLELPKTGSTHTTMLLRSLCGGEHVGLHNRLPEILRDRIACVVGSMRNPWDWYASLWTFGCAGKGVLYQRLVSCADETRARGWRETYADATDPGRFREWLRRLHDPASRADVGERYADTPLSLTCGLLTYRYAYLYADTLDDLYANAAASPARLRALVERNILDFTIRTEHLEHDLVLALHGAGFTLTPAALAFIYTVEKTNASTRRPTAPGYDRTTCDLVGARDRVLIDYYGYCPPDTLVRRVL